MKPGDYAQNNAFKYISKSLTEATYVENKDVLTFLPTFTEPESHLGIPVGVLCSRPCGDRAGMQDDGPHSGFGLLTQAVLLPVSTT